MILILLGPPGVGKGTQARILSHRHGLHQVSTGDMIRHELAEGTQLGKKARDYLDKGNLVPDEVILGMVEKNMKGESNGRGFLFDGFPRTIAQAEALDVILDKLGKKIQAVLSLRVSEERVVLRLSNRRSCPVDGRVYNLLTQKPVSDERCDDHPEIQLVLRSDDKPETVRHRFEVYNGQTRPLIEYYRTRNVLTDVEGEGSVDDVTSRIEAALIRKPE